MSWYFLTSIFAPATVFPKLLNRDVTGNKSAHRTQVIAYCVSQKAYKEGDDLPSQVLKVDGSREDPPVLYMRSIMRARDACIIRSLHHHHHHHHYHHHHRRRLRLHCRFMGSQSHLKC